MLYVLRRLVSILRGLESIILCYLLASKSSPFIVEVKVMYSQFIGQ